MVVMMMAGEERRQRRWGDIDDNGGVVAKLNIAGNGDVDVQLGRWWKWWNGRGRQCFIGKLERGWGEIGGGWWREGSTEEHIGIKK